MKLSRGWLTEPEFLDLLGAASVLPGPTSTQVGILLGKRRAGWAGLIVGRVCFIAPAMTIVTALASAYVRWGTSTAGQGLLYGIKPVVIAIIGDALWGLTRTAIKGRVALAAGGGAALAGYLAGANVLLVLLAVGGAVAGRSRLGQRCSFEPVRPRVDGAVGEPFQVDVRCRLSGCGGPPIREGLFHDNGPACGFGIGERRSD